MKPRSGRRIDTPVKDTKSNNKELGDLITFEFDGLNVTARAGESIAAALIASGHLQTRLSRSAMPRGYYCGMGVCWECLVDVNGLPNQRACMQTVEPGMVVQTAASPKKS